MTKAIFLSLFVLNKTILNMKNLITILFIALSVQLFAQQVGANISWDTKQHSFGEIKEADGKVTYKFEFTNTGNEPLVITNVRPSCGCTSSDYTKEPVAAGAKGSVSATFNPLRRPGKFSKNITVTTNATPPTTVLRFTGNVIAKPKSKKDLYPRELGDLRLKTNHLALAKVYNTSIKTDSIPMANLSANDLKITFSDVPAHISIKAVPAKLKPGTTGYIQVTYDAQKKNDWGFNMDKIIIAINGNTNNNKNRLSVSASISEDFSKLTPEQKAKAPKAVFDSKVFNFGTIKQGESVSHTFSFKNEGKSDLIIHKTKASCGCTVFNIDKDIIKAGETAKFDVTFNSKGKQNRQNKAITLITNDPANSQISLRVTGTVEVTK